MKRYTAMHIYLIGFDWVGDATSSLAFDFMRINGARALTWEQRAMLVFSLGLELRVYLAHQYSFNVVVVWL